MWWNVIIWIYSVSFSVVGLFLCLDVLADSLPKDHSFHVWWDTHMVRRVDNFDFDI